MRYAVNDYNDKSIESCFIFYVCFVCAEVETNVALIKMNKRQVESNRDREQRKMRRIKSSFFLFL